MNFHVGDVVRRISTMQFNASTGKVVEVQGQTVWVQWGGLRVNGPNQPYPVPASDLQLVQAAEPSKDDTGTDEGDDDGGGSQPAKSKLPVFAGLAIAAALLLRGAK